MAQPPLRRRTGLAAAAALGLACAGVPLAGAGAAASAVRNTPRSRTDSGALAAAVTVSPLPGTPDASASTQISFLGNARTTTVADVIVAGSRSGRHAGSLKAYSPATGESFIPFRAFVPGELVTVSARVEQGGRSATVHTSFRVATAAPFSLAPFPPQPGDPAAVVHYLSAPAIAPSKLTVTSNPGAGATPGDLFLAPYQGAGAAGPMIVDQSGNLIWFHPLGAGQTATDFRSQRYEGRSVLTWWQGRILKLGFGVRADEIYDSAYRPIAVVRAGNGYLADLHEFLLSGSGTAWIDAVDPVALPGSHGGRGRVVGDSVLQEIDVRTGLVMWEWHALGHIPLRDSYAPSPPGRRPWYYAHVNSIDPSHAGQLLISARNTWTIYDLSLHTGAIVWRIGGRRSSFALGPGAAFHYQHDAAWQPGGEISVFDNGGAQETQSRGLLLRPDPANRTVALVRQFTNPAQTLLSYSQGDLQRLAGGNWLMGYGGLPNLTEFDAAGHPIFGASLGPDVQSYRAYLQPWSGHPRTAPAIAIQTDKAGASTVEVSWNGATDVGSWEVLERVPGAGATAVERAPARGFETSIAVTLAPGAQVAVAALDAGGRVLAVSATVSPGG